MPIDVEKWIKDRMNQGDIADENGYYHYSPKERDGEQDG